MVICVNRKKSQRAALLIEAAVGMAILIVGIFPLIVGMKSEMTSLRVSYQRAIAAEIVDGEAEILAAGAGRVLTEGTNTWKTSAAAAQNLPDGRFETVRRGNGLRVQWVPASKSGVGLVVREVALP